VRRADNNKPRKSILPLFPGYISICGNPGFELLLYKTNRIVSIIKIKYQLRFMRELLTIRQAQESGLSLEPLETTFVPGDRVEVISGALKGVVGVVNKVKDVCKLVVAVEGLGMAAMTIDSSLVRPAPETIEVDQIDQQT
jgi:transcription antitermination factor NusG